MYYTCRITQTHPITPHNIHTFITWASLLESSQLLFRCKRQISLSVTNSRSHTKRKGNSFGGSAAREGVTFSLYGLTYLFPSMWQNMAHDSFIGFTVWGCIIVEHSSMFFKTTAPVWMTSDASLRTVLPKRGIKLYLKGIGTIVNFKVQHTLAMLFQMIFSVQCSCFVRTRGNKMAK